jgi:hypothetical protein
MTQMEQSAGSGATDTVDVAVGARCQSSTHGVDGVGRIAAAARVAGADPPEMLAVDHNTAVEHNADSGPHLAAAELAVHGCSAAYDFPKFVAYSAAVLAAAASWDANCPQSGREYRPGDRIGLSSLQW